MEEFEDSQLRDLQEVDGIVLRNVHGERVQLVKTLIMKIFSIS